MKAALLLALSAPLLASPVRRDVPVRYTANYANAPTPRQSVPENVAGPRDDPLTNDWDGVLSVEKPIPTSVLMNMAELLGEEADDEGEGEKAADPLEATHRLPEAGGVSCARMGPYAALAALSTLGLLACAVQRYVTQPPYMDHGPELTGADGGNPAGRSTSATS